MKKKKQLVLGLDIGLVILALLAKPVTNRLLALSSGCKLASIGFQCPSCGGTRCVRYLASGQFADAFWINPYFFVSFLYLGVLLVLLNTSVLFGKGEKLLKKLATPTAAIIWAIGLIPFTILRNIIW
jgi:hypothetical protein